MKINKSSKWQKVNWRQVERFVLNKQKLIGVAKREGNLATMKELQKELVRSFEARALGVRRVSSNRGSKTAGVDKKLMKSPAAKWEMIGKLGESVRNIPAYTAQPVKRVWIPKPGKTEKRPLGIPTIFDRCMQATWLLALDPAIEEVSDKSSYGFRKYRSAHHAINIVRDAFLPRASGGATKKTKFRNKTFFTKSDRLWDRDISKCFDKIDHKVLLGLLEDVIHDISPFKKWLEAPIMDDGNYSGKNQAGTPQGGIISPVLANLALNGLDNAVHESLGRRTSPTLYKRLKVGIRIIRYADDFIIAFRSDEQKELFEPAVKEFLRKRGLEISEAKSRWCTPWDGFVFLGYEFKWYNWNSKHSRPRQKGKNWFDKTLIVRPSLRAERKLSVTIKEAFKNCRKLERLVKNLNPKIRGWCNYFANSPQSLTRFKRAEHYLYEKTWKFLRKKHPQRGSKWLHKKYVFPNKERTWRIGYDSTNGIYDPTITPLINVMNVDQSKSPYVEHDYWSNRLEVTGFKGFRKEILKIWKSKCAGCGITLYGDERIEFHHIVEQHKGGKHTLANVVPMHITCHQQVSRQNLNRKSETWKPTKMIPERYKKILEKSRSK